MASSSSVLTETHRLVAPGRVITELTRGREIADRLRLMLRETTGSADSSVFPAQSLVTQLLDTFTHSLTMLRDSDDVSQAPSTAAAAKSEDSGDSCKTPPPAKDRRGCYKRKYVYINNFFLSHRNILFIISLCYRLSLVGLYCLLQLMNER